MSKSKNTIASLVLPDQPPAIQLTQEAWKTARSELQASQDRHRNAMLRQRNQQAGAPPEITAAEVDRIGQEIAPLIEAERTADAARKAESHAYQQQVTEKLLEPLRDLHAELFEVLDKIDELSTAAATLHAAAAKAGVKLPSNLPAVCATKRSIFSMSARQMLQAVRYRNG